MAYPKIVYGAGQNTNPNTHQPASSVERYFEVSLLLMLGTGFCTLATTGRLDPVSILGLSLALGVKFWGYAREANWTLAPRTVTRLAIVYIVLYPLDLLAFSSGPSFGDRMLAATVHLVLFTTVIKVFSARTYRDYGYLAALSFLMMLASAILTVSTKYLALGVKEATLAYHRFLSVLRRKGIQKPASQTPQELALALAHSPLGPGVLEFTRLYNALRFGQTPVSLVRLRSVLEEISRPRRPQAGVQV